MFCGGCGASPWAGLTGSAPLAGSNRREVSGMMEKITGGRRCGQENDMEDWEKIAEFIQKLTGRRPLELWEKDFKLVLAPALTGSEDLNFVIGYRDWQTRFKTMDAIRPDAYVALLGAIVTFMKSEGFTTWDQWREGV